MACTHTNTHHGEVQVAFNFAPTGYLSCEGQQLSITDYAALYLAIGTTYVRMD